MLSACDRIIVISEGRIMDGVNRADLDDPSALTDDPVALLQAAERKLQIVIQKALTKSQGGTHVH